MKIENDKGVFDLPLDFEIEINEHNHMIADDVDMSISVSLPATENNLRLVNFSHRLDAYYKPMSSCIVVVSSGVFSKPANFIFDIINKVEITGTLFFNVNTFYSKIGDKMLNSLSWKVINNPIPCLPENEDLYKNYFINLLKTQWSENDPNEDFIVTQIATDVTRTLKNGDNEIEDVLVLNGFETFKYAHDYGPAGWYLEKFQGEYNHIQLVGGAEVEQGRGYGMTPFLKLDYVISFIFSHFGYEWTGERYIDEYIQTYHGIFVINRVADAVWRTNKLEYNQLVPDVTVKEFLAEIEKLLKGKFQINELKKTVDFLFFKDMDRLTKDLTPFLSSEPIPLSADFDTIILKINDLDEYIFERDFYLEKRTEISFNIPSAKILKKEYLMTYAPQGGSSVTGFMPIELHMLHVVGITHKNTTIVIEGETKEERDAANKDILFGYRTPGETPFSDTHKCSTNLFGWNTYQPAESLSHLYKKYIDFRASSNIEVECTLYMPLYEIMKLEKDIVYYLNNQQVIIESIQYNLSDRNQVDVKCKLRTWRLFSENNV